MDPGEYRRLVAEVKARAHGHWPRILIHLGVADRVVNGKNQPCPLCGGTDRFQYTDKFDDGNYYCRHCGPGDGFTLAEGVLGLGFAQVLRRVQEALGLARVTAPGSSMKPSDEFMKRLARTMWHESQAIVRGDPVDRYLRARGLGMDVYPGCLRCHPRLAWYAKKDPAAKKSTKMGEFPALLAPLTNENGEAVTVHRTYVHEGRKAPMPSPKKCVNSFTGGPAIRLFEPTDVLALAEGIETALAVHLSTRQPVWATYSASNLAQVWVPETVQKVRIYADNDASFTGQAAAFALARRLKSAERRNGIARDVEVHVAPGVDKDWADFRLERFRLTRAA